MILSGIFVTATFTFTLFVLGRKDASQAMYCYMEKAPKKLWYDFACGAEEYCLTREAGFFKDTEFKHDIFHGYSHTCSRVYKIRGENGYRHVNTSICEQFNAYIKCIRKSGQHMSQVHFIFFAQFMMDEWNTAKRMQCDDIAEAIDS